jgi:hypothetical protein
VNAENSEREELSQFLSKDGMIEGLSRFFKKDGMSRWNVLSVFGFSRPVQMSGKMEFQIAMEKHPQPQIFWKISAYGTADFAVRPKNPGIIEGGMPLRFSTDDPRLADPELQYVPGGDGEVYNPPRHYQLLELDQSWIIAERFEIEPLPQTSVG